MKQHAICLTLPNLNTDIVCDDSTLAETRERHLNASSKLVVSSVCVRGLAASVCEVPLIMKLMVGGCSLLTGQLLPTLTDKEEAGRRECSSPTVTPSNYSSNPVQMGLEDLHIVIPIVAEWGSHTVRGAFNGHRAAQIDEALSVLRRGVRVALCTANGGVFLGSALCPSSGDWFPISPCGGEAKLMFKLFLYDGIESIESCLPAQSVLKSQLGKAGLHCHDKEDDVNFAFMAADGCIGNCLHMSHMVLGSRQTQSADAVLKGFSLCSKKTFLCGGPLDRRSSTHKRPTSAGLTTAALLASSVESTASQPHLGLVQRRTFPVNYHALPASSVGRLRGLRGSVSQPRSLVFYDIRVSGFLPLSNFGSWRLEFSWSQPQVSATRQIIQIPTYVDSNGAVAVKETFSIDLPLFMRGEIQTNMHAIWSCKNHSDERTDQCVTVGFDPISAFLRDSEMCWDAVRRHASIVADGVSLVASDLFVELAVRLEFFEPQRDGQNGRPTSAFQHNHLRGRAYVKPDESVDEEAGSETLSIFTRSLTLSLRSSSQDYEESGSSDTHCGEDVEIEDHCQVETPMCNGLSLVSKRSSTLFSCVRSDRATQTDISLPYNYIYYQQEQGEDWTKHEDEEELQEEQQCVNRSLILQSSVTTPYMLPNVQDMVPCYSERQRRVVFQAYDAEGCGSMTREQLLHFCRAHVALFNGEESDESILRRLQPYVRGKPRCYYSAPLVTSHSQRHYVKELINKGHTTRSLLICGTDGNMVSSFLSNAQKSNNAHVPKASTLTELSVGNPGYITYNMFEIIALRLASM